jgi:crotonobetainyl-CoA:carnitine CoA-transferase CaiB-like acyl-CoA transferase
LGQPALATDPRFVDSLTRYRHQEELDDIIGGWTSTRGQYQAMEQLQAAGVPAGPVLNASGLLADPHLRARNLFETVEHPPETGLGNREYLGRGWKLSGNSLRIRGPAPRLGEANDYVLAEVLGLSPNEIADLRKEGVIGEDLTGAGAPSTVPLDRQAELGWIVEYDVDF